MNNKPWELPYSPWNTQSAFMSWVRGGLRKGLWNTHPVKLQFIKDNTIKIKNTNKKSAERFPYVNGGECSNCKECFRINELQVDHKDGNASLKTIDDLLDFFKKMVLVTVEDLQFLCKPCHKIKSYAEKENVSFEEAEATKLAIALIADKKDKDWLISKGIKPASNQKARREQIINEVMEWET